MTEKPAPDVVEAAFREGYEQGRANGETHHIPDDAWRCSNARGALQARPDAALAGELAAHVAAADAQVATGQFGPECEAFGEWVWENRHRILSALRTHDDTLEEAIMVLPLFTGEN